MLVKGMDMDTRVDFCVSVALGLAVQYEGRLGYSFAEWDARGGAADRHVALEIFPQAKRRVGALMFFVLLTVTMTLFAERSGRFAVLYVAVQQPDRRTAASQSTVAES